MMVWRFEPGIFAVAKARQLVVVMTVFFYIVSLFVAAAPLSSHAQANAGVASESMVAAADQQQDKDKKEDKKDEKHDDKDKKDEKKGLPLKPDRKISCAVVRRLSLFAVPARPALPDSRW